MTTTCKDCLYYKPEVGIEMVHDFGSCTRFPPVVVLDPEGDPFSMFPLVNSDEHCGEWKASQ
jgi:hypothetical protein